MTSTDTISRCSCCGKLVKLVHGDSTYSGTIHNCRGVVSCSSENDTKSVPKTNDFMDRIFEKQKDDKFRKKGLK